MTRVVQNVAASVRQRLRNLANERGDVFDQVLVLYAIERFLYRLSQSPHRNHFVLKGAMLLHVWKQTPRRPTRDVDLLGFGKSDVKAIAEVFREICSADVEDDGVVFKPDTVHTEVIRGAQEYDGIRVKLEAELSGAVIRVQIDVGFGDAVTPEAETVTYPTLLDHTPPKLRAYPPETVLAEKFQAMVSLGIANSRMKDFYDVWLLIEMFSFKGETIQAAIDATFASRQTAIPSDVPTALSSVFHSDPMKTTQWSALRNRLDLDCPDLRIVAEKLSSFYMPPLEARAEGRAFLQRWPAGGPWQES